MPDLLTTLWDRAEAKHPRFSGDEALVLGDGAMDFLCQQGLVRSIENARSVPCDACAEGHIEEVTYIEGPPDSEVRAYLHCPDHGRVRVPLDRLRQWEVDFSGLASAVARALELAGNVEEITADRIWFLGKTTIAAHSREIFLARGLTWVDARTVFGGNVRLNAARSVIVHVVEATDFREVWSGDPPPIVALKTVVHVSAKGLSIDRGHLESLLPKGRKRAPTTPTVSFPTPEGTLWRNVRLTLADNEVRIEARGKVKDYTFKEAGFEEGRRKDVPDRLWMLLRLFAVHGGILPLEAISARDRGNLKHNVSELRKRITALIPNIDGDLITYQRDERAYRMAFKILSREGVKFLTPSDARWEDVSISRIGTSDIHISVTVKERFASSTYSEEDDGRGHHWEAAEREGSMDCTYDLRTLRLADDRERSNRAGKALLSVIAGGGAVERDAEDKGMLDLCAVLSALIDIEGSPFRFDKSEKKWIAVFDAGDGA